MLDWYVAKIKPHADRMCALSMASDDVETYAPEIVVPKGGRQVTEPLFPGYLFVRLDVRSDAWRRIRWGQGVHYFLPNRLDPVPVGEELIADLRSRVGEWNGEGWTKAFGLGDPVSLQTGALRGLDAIFQRYVARSQRCEVLVSLVGGDHCVQVDVRALSALSLGRGTFKYVPA